MAAATIVFTDIVGFSKKPTAEQRRVVDELNGNILGNIRLLLWPPLGTPRVVALPTGDGAALALLHDGSNPIDVAVLFQIIVSLQKWAAGAEGVQLRIGVHVGAVSFITDVNSRTNVCGDTINYSQRVMDAANPCQVLFSEAAFREYVTDPAREFSGPPFPAGATARFEGPLEVFAKHGLRIPVYKMCLSGTEWWSNDDPKAKDWALVSLTPLPKEIGGTFSDRLAHARQVALIQLTGDRLLDALREKKTHFSETLQRLWVFLPDPESYKLTPHSSAHATPEFVDKNVDGWKEYLLTLRSSLPGADIKLGLFREPAYLGASFLNWDRTGGQIHVSTYVWGVPTPKCPGYELEWLSRNPSPVYETYVQGLNYLNGATRNVLTD